MDRCIERELRQIKNSTGSPARAAFFMMVGGAGCQTSAVFVV